VKASDDEEAAVTAFFAAVVAVVLFVAGGGFEPRAASLNVIGTTTWSPATPVEGPLSPKTMAHPVPVVLPAGGH
jgi:hypothetical protein